VNQVSCITFASLTDPLKEPLMTPILIRYHLIVDVPVYLFSMPLTSKCMGFTLVLSISKELRPERIKKDPDKITLPELPNTNFC
jgi:hypothetical protein